VFVAVVAVVVVVVVAILDVVDAHAHAHKQAHCSQTTNCLSVFSVFCRFFGKLFSPFFSIFSPLFLALFPTHAPTMTAAAAAAAAATPAAATTGAPDKVDTTGPPPLPRARKAPITASALCIGKLLLVCLLSFALGPRLLNCVFAAVGAYRDGRRQLWLCALHPYRVEASTARIDGRKEIKETIIKPRLSWAATASAAQGRAVVVVIVVVVVPASPTHATYWQARPTAKDEQRKAGGNPSRAMA
jgi:hypothetical protein